MVLAPRRGAAPGRRLLRTAQRFRHRKAVEEQGTAVKGGGHTRKVIERHRQDQGKAVEIDEVSDSPGSPTTVTTPTRSCLLMVARERTVRKAVFSSRKACLSLQSYPMKVHMDRYASMSSQTSSVTTRSCPRVGRVADKTHDLL